MPRLRWGISGPGWIAERFVAALRAHTTQEVAAVQSSDPERARRFAERHGIAKHFGGTDMLGDPGIDVVYVSSVHHRHLPDALAAIGSGRHVLVEKPLALNASEAERLREAARHAGVLLAEAYWPAFTPKFDVLRQLLADGAIGAVRTVIADHGEWFGPEHRIMRPELAGGPMLDLGTYPVSFALGVLGVPERVTADGAWAPGGVNGQAAMLLSHPNGARSVLHTSILGHTPGDAVVSGSGGMIHLPGRFYTPGPFTLTANDLRTQLVWEEERNGYAQLFHQAVHVAAYIGRGEREAALRPPSDSIAALRVMDEARRQLGVEFPGEGGRS